MSSDTSGLLIGAVSPSLLADLVPQFRIEPLATWQNWRNSNGEPDAYCQVYALLIGGGWKSYRSLEARRKARSASKGQTGPRLAVGMVPLQTDLRDFVPFRLAHLGCWKCSALNHVWGSPPASALLVKWGSAQAVVFPLSQLALLLPALTPASAALLMESPALSLLLVNASCVEDFSRLIVEQTSQQDIWEPTAESPDAASFSRAGAR